MPILDAHRDTNAQIELVNQNYINESPHLLLAASILGILGFFIALVPYVLRILGYLYRSETPPLTDIPPTVSALVSKWDTVEARIFFGFELTSAYCMLLSWYPYKLRNACCVPASGGCRLLGMSWATFRQFVPPIGLILVACCPTVDVTTDTFKAADLVLVFVHCVAAMMMFIGFLMSEAHALSTRLCHCWTPFPCRRSTVAEGSLEHWRRTASLYASGTNFVLFLVLQVLIVVWPTAHDESLYVLHIASFLTEVLAGLAMLANHLAVWRHSPERTWSRRGVVGDWSNATVQPRESLTELAAR